MVIEKMKILIFLVVLHVNFELGHAQLGSNCTTPDQYPGQCVEIFSCPILSRLRHKEPQLHEDRIYITRSLCGYDDKVPLICCSSRATYPLRALSGRPSGVKTSTAANQRLDLEESDEE